MNEETREAVIELTLKVAAEFGWVPTCEKCRFNDNHSFHYCRLGKKCVNPGDVCSEQSQLKRGRGVFSGYAWEMEIRGN